MTAGTCSYAVEWSAPPSRAQIALSHAAPNKPLRIFSFSRGYFERRESNHFMDCLADWLVYSLDDDMPIGLRTHEMVERIESFLAASDG